MLKSHLDAVERHLLAISQIPANAGHMLHRGTPREAFIREFLQGHLSSKLAVGTGEIIDANSAPREPRNQFDIVIYKSDSPRIDLGGGISAFLAESVVATIEVKSLLTEAELATANRNAAAAKRLTRNLFRSFSTGWVPPGIISFLVSYAGPARIETVHGWVERSDRDLGINQAPLPPPREQHPGMPPAPSPRLSVVGGGIDACICLGLGSIIFDNSPISLVEDAQRIAQPLAKRLIIEEADGNLLWLFLLLTEAAFNVSAQWPNMAAYLGRHQFRGLFR